MSGISKYTYTTLKQAILDYTEVDDTVFTTTVLDGFIMSAEMRINQELPTDADRFVQEGTLVADDNTINAPAGTLFIRGIEVFDSTSVTTGKGTWLEKKRSNVFIRIHRQINRHRRRSNSTRCYRTP